MFLGSILVLEGLGETKRGLAVMKTPSRTEKTNTIKDSIFCSLDIDLNLQNYVFASTKMASQKESQMSHKDNGI